MIVVIVVTLIIVRVVILKLFWFVLAPDKRDTNGDLNFKQNSFY